MSVTITSMSSSSPPKTDATEEKPAKKAGKGKLILIAVPVVLLLLGDQTRRGKCDRDIHKASPMRSRRDHSKRHAKH